MKTKQATKSVEQQILEFANARPAFTSAQLAAYCSAVSDWKRTNTLRDLKRRQIIKPCGTYDGCELLTAFDPRDAKDNFLSSDSALEKDLRSKALNAQMQVPPFVTDPDTWAPDDAQEAKLWSTLQKQIRFSRANFLEAANMPLHQAETLFRRWQRAKMIRFVHRSNGVSLFTSISPEQMQREGKDKRMSPEGRMWTAMRVSRIFTTTDLHFILTGAGITSAEVQRYCSKLAEFGYLRVLQKAGRRKPAKYQLIRNTGPLPPVGKKISALIDPNTEEVQYGEGVLS